MAVCGHHRKERTHNTGNSNRPKMTITSEPINFDASMRSTLPQEYRYKMDSHVPIAVTGTGNMDFSPKLPGDTYRQPAADKRETRIRRKEQRAQETLQATLDATKPASTILGRGKGGHRVDEEGRETKQKGFKAAPRWNPRQWYQAPPYEQAPLQKDEGHVWNSMESQKVQGEIKGQDRLFRSVRRPEDVATPTSEAGKRHPLNYDKDEYYPGRGLIDALGEEPANDFQVRPVNLPDFYNPPAMDADSVTRMQRLREVVKQRYAGRPRLIGVFRNCALRKPGFVFPKDLQQVFDQMGIKVNDNECDMLVRAVDKDKKGAITFEEFADLIYGPRVNVGGGEHEPQERHVRHVTKTLVDNLIHNGQQLGKAFCELDPERRYAVSKPQFANALGTACNHISAQAVDFLWASQFPGEEGRNTDARCIDWRSFMSQLAHFAHDHRPPTPCCVQGRKRQYDLLQRTAAITGGYASDLDLNRPDQNASDKVSIVADQLVHRETELPHRPRDAAHLTEHYVEVLRDKALRVERALPQRISQGRLKALLKNRDKIHQDDLIQLLCDEMDAPNQLKPLAAQEPLYASTRADVMTLDPKSLGEAAAAAADEPERPHDHTLGDGYSGPACLKLVPADIEAFVVTQHHDRDYEVDVQSLIKNVYRPPDEKKVIDSVNDGLNRALRGHRPPRERPPDSEEPRYENYWQARYMMESIADAITTVENSNGGKTKASRVFKRLDHDNDGYITLSDLKSACEKYKIPHENADLHAMFSELDPHDKGSVHIGEFTRNYDIRMGNLLDNMQKPIRGAYHEGGVDYVGPVQDEHDARMQRLEERERANLAKQASASSAASAPAEAMAPGSPERDRAGSAPPSTASRSVMGQVGMATMQPPIYGQEVAMMVGRGRISDVIRARTMHWKPMKSELYTSLPKTRYGMTIHPDTRHITEPTMPLAHSYMGDGERFKTTNNVIGLFAAPDPLHPQAEDTMRKHSRNEYRVERIRQRQRDFAERCWAANEAAQEFDELKVARKAMNLLNYERKCHMACA